MHVGVHAGGGTAFMPFIAKQFEAVAPGKNTFAILSPTENYLAGYDASNLDVWRVSRSPRDYWKFLRQVRRARVVVVHSLDSPASVLALLLSRRCATCAWSGWGFDYYDTKRWITRGTKAGVTSAPVALARWSTRWPARLKRAAYTSLKDLATRRVSLFSAPIPEDFEVARANFPRMRARYKQLNYGSVEETFLVGAGPRTGKDILIGNSATPSNDHFNLLKQLSELDLSDRKVIAPLAYGDPVYRNYVIEYGQALLGSLFVPLLEVVPLAEYNKLLNHCQIVVMGQERQQGLGTLCAALHRGSRVYLHPDNNVYRFLMKRGAVVWNLSDLDNLQDVSWLDDTAVHQNRDVLQSFWGKTVVEENTRAFVSEALQQCRRSPIRAHRWSAPTARRKPCI